MQITLPTSEVIIEARSPRPRGFITNWNPRGDTLGLVTQVQDVLAELAADEIYTPTKRQVYYRLVGTRGYGKTERDYKRLIEITGKACRARMIPISAFRDDGTTRSNPPGFHSEESARAAIEAALEQGAINRMTMQPIWQWVVCEAAGMLPQLARVADRYGAIVISAGGFNGLTEKYEWACEMADNERPNLIWHIGDFDPSGVHVFQSLAEDVTAFFHEADGDEISFQRLAVTPDQIAHYNLPTAPSKKTDARAFDGSGTVQAEAIPPAELSKILDNALAAYFDPEADAAARVESDAAADRIRSEYGIAKGDEA